VSDDICEKATHTAQQLKVIVLSGRKKCSVQNRFYEKVIPAYRQAGRPSYPEMKSYPLLSIREPVSRESECTRIYEMAPGVDAVFCKSYHPV